MWKTALAAMLAFSAAPSLSQPSTPPPPTVSVDPAAIEEARALLRAIGFDAQLEQAAQLSADATFDTMIAAQERVRDFTMPEELRAELRELLREQVSSVIAAMKPTALEDSARVYARYFTADELRELQRLQTNPVMVKAQRIAPALVTELSQIGMAVVAERQPALQAKVEELVRDWMEKRRASGESRS